MRQHPALLWSIVQVFQTSDFQQAFRKVIACNGRYQQGNNKPRCSVFAIHVYIWKQSLSESAKTHMGLLQSETVAGTLQEPKGTSHTTLETFAREQIT